jgi:hypothetical protein
MLSQGCDTRHFGALIFSATGTRGNLTIPHSMASMSEKSLIVHGNKVPSAYPEPLRKMA